MIDKDKYIMLLNNPDYSKRIEASKMIGAIYDNGYINIVQTNEVNNHVHTKYSFSPYYPAMAAYMAWTSGLKAVGIVDHDSVSGCKEMLIAGKNIGIATTVGMEMRVNFTNTNLEGRKINNPSSMNNAYIAFHGIPANKIAAVRRFLKPIQKARNLRNIEMVEAINDILKSYYIEPIDYKRDILGNSCAADGGSVTERHILYALSLKLIKKVGVGEPLVNYLSSKFGESMAPKIKANLLDKTNSHYIYDLIGVLKQSFLERVFIQPDDRECISVYTAVNFANKIKCLPVYAYLGDIIDSPTGDKKAEKFEDDFLNELIMEIKRIGFKGLTYMPPRNTLEQLKRIQRLCREYDLMEISGVDINSSRQSFNCPILLEKEFSHLIDATWALIAHEKLTNFDPKYSIFHKKNPYANLPLGERIKVYSDIGKKINVREPEGLKKVLKF